MPAQIKENKKMPAQTKRVLSESFSVRKNLQEKKHKALSQLSQLNIKSNDSVQEDTVHSNYEESQSYQSSDSEEKDIPVFTQKEKLRHQFRAKTRSNIQLEEDSENTDSEASDSEISSTGDKESQRQSKQRQSKQFIRRQSTKHLVSPTQSQILNFSSLGVSKDSRIIPSLSVDQFQTNTEEIDLDQDIEDISSSNDSNKKKYCSSQSVNSLSISRSYNKPITLGPANTETLKQGDPVIIRGLKKKTEYNNQLGYFHSVSEEKPNKLILKLSQSKFKGANGKCRVITIEPKFLHNFPKQKTYSQY